MSDPTAGRKYNHVAVLMGGWSAEREVSLSSGRECANALEAEGFTVTRVDADRDLAARLRRAEARRLLQRAARTLGRGRLRAGPARGAEYPLHALGRARLRRRHAQGADQARRAGASACRSRPARIVTPAEALAEHALAPPYVAKPIAEGSSVGVVIVKLGANRPPEAIRTIPVTRDGEIMVERFVPGRELTCGVIGDTATDIIDIVPAANLEFYDYEAKYAPGGSRHILPAQIPAHVRDAVRKHTLAAHQALGCRGISRCDFRWDDERDELIFLEINTQPGMTPTSLIPELGRLRWPAVRQAARLAG